MPPAKPKWSVPLTQALPVLAAAVAVTGFAFQERAERRELRRELTAASHDRFQGRDMDLFIERIQVVFDNHTRTEGTPAVTIPSWRQTP